MSKKKLQNQRVTLSPYLNWGKRAAFQDGADDDAAPVMSSPPPSVASPIRSVSTAGSPAPSPQSPTPQLDGPDTVPDDAPVTAHILRAQLAQLQATLFTTITQSVSSAVAIAMKEIQEDFIQMICSH
ncbi:hypothetical protein XELAEV_18006789mg [Xenopus laevis]|uniref:Uncharacterized protein n=1 Tax=Xenopus laevis TaxID=8355 RepID=A0A974E1L1_XENLA|nr:hypothetical protein XELAEV_18006789mg [Xenopus laevis]